MIRTLGVGEHKPCQQDCLELAIQGEPAQVVANDTYIIGGRSQHFKRWVRTQ